MSGDKGKQKESCKVWFGDAVAHVKRVGLQSTATSADAIALADELLGSGPAGVGPGATPAWSVMLLSGPMKAFQAPTLPDEVPVTRQLLSQCVAAESTVPRRPSLLC